VTRPGTEIISRDQPLPRSAPTDTGVWFVAGATETGPAGTPTLITSLTQYETIFGSRSGSGQKLYDAVDAYFREGGAKVYVSAEPSAAAMLTAEGPDLAAMTRQELDTYAEEHGVEDAADLPNKDAVIAALGGAGGAEPGAQSASSLVALLDNFTSDLGPGQVSIPGGTDSVSHDGLLDHAASHNRIALLDAAPALTAAALVALATALQAGDNTRYGAIFAPDAIIPGVASGTTRQVSFAALEAGMIARTDALYGPNVPAAGTVGLSRYALDLSDLYTDVEYEDLNEGGVDMARLIYGGVEAYGYRTLVDPDGPDAAWLDLGNARLNMAIVAQAEAVAERYVFSQIDGRGHTISQFGAELRAMLVPFYEGGQLYGSTPDEAFYVDVGAQVNTPETIAAGELHAVIEVRMSPFAELVVIEIVKVATTQALAA
jgi:phage tail sheath protein FI